jgi:hypothetical protein
MNHLNPYIIQQTPNHGVLYKCFVLIGLTFVALNACRMPWHVVVLIAADQHDLPEVSKGT